MKDNIVGVIFIAKTRGKTGITWKKVTWLAALVPNHPSHEIVFEHLRWSGCSISEISICEYVLIYTYIYIHICFDIAIYIYIYTYVLYIHILVCYIHLHNIDISHLQAPGVWCRPFRGWRWSRMCWKPRGGQCESMDHLCIHISSL